MSGKKFNIELDLRANENLEVYKGALYENVGYGNDILTLPYFTSFLLRRYLRSLV